VPQVRRDGGRADGDRDEWIRGGMRVVTDRDLAYAVSVTRTLHSAGGLKRCRVCSPREHHSDAEKAENT
jgi:hypothetical protein